MRLWRILFEMRLWRILLPIRMSIKFGFLVGTSSPPPVASALALVFRESKSTELNQLFAFSA